MRAFRRAAVALGLGALGGIVLRLRGNSGATTQTGGWRELSGDDLR